METVFLICATVGGTILVCQFVMMFLGLAGDSADADMGGDFDGDVGGDLDGDMGGDLDGDVDGDVGGDTDGDVAGHDGSYSFVRALSLRTVVAAVTFFGIGGMATSSAEAATPVVLLVALACGGGAFYGVYWIMRTLHGLRSEGTVQVRRAVGRHGTVYLRIPEHESGTGKIQINLQNRTMEYLAMTSGETIPIGTKIVVVDILTPDTVAVEPVIEPERVNHA